MGKQVGETVDFLKELLEPIEQRAEKIAAMEENANKSTETTAIPSDSTAYQAAAAVDAGSNIAAATPSTNQAPVNAQPGLNVLYADDDTAAKSKVLGKVNYEGTLDKVAAMNQLKTKILSDIDVDANQLNGESMNLLNKYAAEIIDQAAVAPEAVAPEAPLAGNEENAIGMDELASLMDEHGVTPEELQEAMQVVEELGQQGVSPEMIMDELSKGDGEDDVEKVASAIQVLNKYASDDVEANIAATAEAIGAQPEEVVEAETQEILEQVQAVADELGVAPEEVLAQVAQEHMAEDNEKVASAIQVLNKYAAEEQIADVEALADANGVAPEALIQSAAEELDGHIQEIAKETGVAPEEIIVNLLADADEDQTAQSAAALQAMQEEGQADNEIVKEASYIGAQIGATAEEVLEALI